MSDILTLASEAGLSVRMSGLLGGMEHLYRFAEAVAKQERQRCIGIIQSEMDESHAAESREWCALEYVRNAIKEEK